LDDISAVSTCVYCGERFDVTPQLKDRDWRYRRSGLFGRDDNQLGGIPVALALSQLETSLHTSLLMYSTSLKFSPTSANIENCEADFVAVIAGPTHIGEFSVQILIGEAKTHMPFDNDDVRKLGKLADAIPTDVGQAFIMFAKADAFTPNEISLARAINAGRRHRVILWSSRELEPYFVYSGSQDRLNMAAHGSTLSGMAAATDILWFAETPEPPPASPAPD